MKSDPEFEHETFHSEQGLSSEDVRLRIARDGPNRLPESERHPVWRRFGKELIHFYALLFWIAGSLAFIARMPELGIAIIIVILLNGTFAFAQEERATRATRQLRQLLPARVSVLRDGVTCLIDPEQLVVDDIVLLSAGDRIPADLQLTEINSLAIDTSTFTGESTPAHPEAGGIAYAGCFVTEGEASARVIATGARTRLAAIAMMTEHKSPPTPLRRELDRSSRRMAAIASAVGIAFLAVSVLIGMPISDGFTLAIGITVAVVPFGLLPTVTLSLANGAKQMANQQALARHLEAVETLGSTTFICTDKTGTLTCNEMVVVEVWTPDGSATISGAGYTPEASILSERPDLEPVLRELALAARKCSTGRVVQDGGKWVARGDPTEAAIDAFARRVGVNCDDELTRAVEVIRHPFDARRRRTSVIVDGELFVKGAPDAIIERSFPVHGAIEAVNSLTSRGLRVLGVASRNVDASSMTLSADEIERDLSLIGLIAIEDPPRDGVKESIAACRSAGIKVAMITGDHPRTARAVAEEVGLADSSVDIIEGSRLPSDLNELGQLVDRDGAVFARVSPEDKLRIARALQQRGHVVAMTGDGVNDAPALREADIGVAMGKVGTDVAREAADLVLLDDHFATIVTAIKLGRATFSNIRRFLTYHLTDNVAELAPFLIWAISARRFPLAIGVLQVLALDIGTDVLPALALGAEPPPEHVMERPPVRGHLLDLKLATRAFGVLGPVEAFMELAAFITTFAAIGWRPGDQFPRGSHFLAASGAAFSAVVLGQVANAFACRSTVKPVWKTRFSANPLLLWAIGSEMILLTAFLGVGPVARTLGHSIPSPAGLVVALATIPAVLVADTIYKEMANRRPRT